MTEPIFNVLFLCTGNSARSILAQSLLRQMGDGRFRAFSAGSHPSGQVHPQTRAVLKAHHFPSAGLRSKAWDEFANPAAPQMDFVITVCDKAAGEVCPVWPGQPISAHWGIADPAAVEGNEKIRQRAFEEAMAQLQRRISMFVCLPFAALDRIKLERAVRDIGTTI